MLSNEELTRRFGPEEGIFPDGDAKDQLHHQLSREFKDLATTLDDSLPDSRIKFNALEALELSSMWARKGNKEIT